MKKLRKNSPMKKLVKIPSILNLNIKKHVLYTIQKLIASQENVVLSN